jgi:hypothetical protein
MVQVKEITWRGVIHLGGNLVSSLLLSSNQAVGQGKTAALIAAEGAHVRRCADAQKTQCQLLEITSMTA